MNKTDWNDMTNEERVEFVAGVLMGWAAGVVIVIWFVLAQLERIAPWLVPAWWKQRNDNREEEK